MSTLEKALWKGDNVDSSIVILQWCDHQTQSIKLKYKKSF